MGPRAYFSILSLPRSRAGLAETSKGYPLLPHGLLEEHIDRLGGADAELREELRSVVPRLPLHAYGDVDCLHADLPASCVRNAAIVRAAGGMFLESVMA